MNSIEPQAQVTISTGGTCQESIWKLGKQPKKLRATAPPNESAVIHALIAAPEILSPDFLIIGQQENAGSGQIADLIAIDREGTLYQVELALRKPLAEALVAVLGCRAWLGSLAVTDAARMYARFSNGDDFEAEFMRYFNVPIPEVEFNGQRGAVLLTTAAEPRSVRGIAALAGSGVEVSVLLLRFYEDADDVLMSCERVAP